MTHRAEGRSAPAGLWSLALCSAAAAPVSIVVAVAHRAQWPVGDVEPWGGYIIPLAFLAWGAACGLLLGGFGASLAPTGLGHPRRLLESIRRSALGLGICVLGLVPSVVWLVRLGAAPTGEIVARASVAVACAGLAALLSSTAGTFLPFFPSTLVGCGACAGGLWLWVR